MNSFEIHGRRTALESLLKGLEYLGVHEVDGKAEGKGHQKKRKLTLLGLNGRRLIS
jgi:hypothetical protein